MWFDKKMQIIEMFKRRNFDRVHPLGWMFFFGFLVFFAGMSFSLLRIFAWFGGTVLVIYALGFFLWARENI